MSHPCVCCPPDNFDDNDVDIITDPNLKIYFAPLTLKTCSDRNIFSENRPLIYERNKLTYKFQEVPNFPNSRIFDVTIFNTFHLNGKVFNLSEFHIHDKGENIIDDVVGAAEIHFVFEEKDKPMNVAVLAFILVEKDTTHKMITRLLNQESFRIPEIKNYFTYSGSLTKVNPSDIPQLAVCWNISTSYLPITKDDLLQLRTTYARYSADTQPSNGRNIILIKNC